MTIIDDINDIVKKVQLEVNKGLTNPKCTGEMHYRATVESALMHIQDLYNVVELALNLLENHPGERPEFIKKLTDDLMGSYHDYNPFYKVSLQNRGSATFPEYYWDYSREYKSTGGLRVVIHFLSEALGYEVKTEYFVQRVVSAVDAFRLVRGAITRLKSRLKWLVMYPDSLSKDAENLRIILTKHGFLKVWMEFSAGITNLRKGDLLDSTNRFANSIVELIGNVAKKYGFTSQGFGTRTLFLERIGFIHSYTGTMISSFYGYLSKFRKGEEPSFEESRFLLDLAFSIHGHITDKLDSFKAKQTLLDEAAKETKKITRQKTKQAKK
jgi:hypothetical protein